MHNPSFASSSAFSLPFAMYELDLEWALVHKNVTDWYLSASALIILTYCLILGEFIDKLSKRADPIGSAMIEATNLCPS